MLNFGHFVNVLVLYLLISKFNTKEILIQNLKTLKKISKYAEIYLNGVIKLVEMGFFD
jgi:hypothetical protein